jgi:predicted ATPase
MRGYERITGQPLARNGANLSAVLYGLKKGGKGDQETLERLLGRIRQVPEEPFSDLSFVDTDLNDVIFGFRHTEQSPLRDARILSDGTLRCLAVLTALETAEERSRIVIEEFDNGVHPSRVKVLSAAMEDCAERKALNVLATTHNPATLDGLSLEQLQNVVMCVWDAGQAASRLVRLTELPRFMEFMNRGRLGDLVTRKVLDRYLAPDSEEKRRAQAGQWVESLP